MWIHLRYTVEKHNSAIGCKILPNVPPWFIIFVVTQAPCETAVQSSCSLVLQSASLRSTNCFLSFFSEKGLFPSMQFFTLLSEFSFWLMISRDPFIMLTCWISLLSFTISWSDSTKADVKHILNGFQTFVGLPLIIDNRIRLLNDG